MDTADDKNSLRVWTLYEKPADHPDHWVLRCSTITAPGHIVPDKRAYRFDKHNQAEAWLEQQHPGLYFMARSLDDDPNIAGTFF